MSKAGDCLGEIRRGRRNVREKLKEILKKGKD